MKTRIFIFTTLVFALSACCDSSRDKAKAMGLVCINGKVFKQEHTTKGLVLVEMTQELTPLNVECPSGKVEVQ